MYKVLKVDGPNLVTDRGCVCITGFQYADGGKSHPVGTEDWRKMRDLFIAAPQLVAALKVTQEQGQHEDGCGWWHIPVRELDDSPGSQARQQAACDCYLGEVRKALENVPE